MGNLVNVQSLLGVQSVLVRPIVTVGLTSLLFGLYALLFTLSFYLLWTHQNAINRRLHLISVVCLFVMATGISLVAAANDVSDSLVFFHTVQTQDMVSFRAYLAGSPTKRGLSGTVYVGYALTNCIGDFVLIHRLYTIWGTNKRLVIAFPIMASVLSNAFGLAVGIMQNVQFIIDNVEFMASVADCRLGYYIANAVTNSMVTLMLAGRIWWAAQDTHVTGSGCLQRNNIHPEFRAIIAMILESGVMYPTVLVVHVALVYNASAIGVPVNFTPVIILFAGIAPTSIILLTNIKQYLWKCQPEGKSLSLQSESMGVKE
ncbi:hypothetical protein Moror_10751 [Moniliophthora roreri MCA 2997]|uniref:Uncharacterized protein n=1 Tax=Moniliophthora roreri (strain MCA 2997) TaxID=1381753 RepID=V2X2N4_MONRO|nr:hypothetical protein Moror_10751 [Moniliophthora roreri MCA 2997]